MRKKASQHHNAQRNRQIVGWTFLTDRGRREIDNHTMPREIQPCVFYSSLDALAAFLHGCIRQTNNRYARQTIGVIHFYFNDDAFEANDSTRVNARKHAGSLDEAD